MEDTQKTVRDYTQSKELTEREKAIIFWAVYSGCRDWKKIYLLSRPGDPEKYDLKAISIPATVSRWKHSKRIADYYNEIRTNYENAQTAQAVRTARQKQTEQSDEDGGNETETTSTKKSKPTQIDFTNKESLLEYLNKKANDITDEKQRTDYIKMIADLVKIKDNGDGKNDINRFYMPLRCQDCKIYQAAKDNETGTK